MGLQSLGNFVVHLQLLVGQNSWGTPIKSCLKGQDIGERQGNLEGHTRWCIGRTILGLGELLDRFDNLVQSSKFAKISINSEKTLSQNQSSLLTHTVNYDVCF